MNEIFIKEEWKDKGFIDEALPQVKDIKEEIRRLCEEKNAIILAHYYTDGSIQDVAHFVGDSLALAQQAEKTSADIIVMCGVHFMAETNKILCPDKLVLLPDLNAGCSLADSCKAADLAKFKEEHPDYKVVAYVNTSAAVKALTDIVVTSSNARAVVDSFDKDEKIAVFTQMYNAIGVRRLCEERINELFAKCDAYIDAVSVPAERKTELKKFVDSLLNRNL